MINNKSSMSSSILYVKRSLLFLLHAFVIVVLTVATQIGGVVYLLALLVAQLYKLRRWWAMGIFVGVYLLATLLIVPLLAPLFGREALPWQGTLRPISIGICLLNRHYATPKTKQLLLTVSEKLNTQYKGAKTNYLDANFPFINGFPLVPHLSHNDGRKVDLAFCYQNGGKPSNDAPGWFGYGVCEAPKAGEQDYPAICQQKGYWQYGILAVAVPKWARGSYAVDQQRTEALLRLLARHPATSKIFLEPHLKQRWGLGSYKNIRFHGCRAVRHDDHIHVQTW